MKITLRTATIGIYALASLAGCERKATPAAQTPAAQTPAAQTPNEKAPVAAVAPPVDAAKAVDAAAPVDQTPALFKAQSAPTRGIVECNIYDIKTVGLPAISDDGSIVAIGSGDDGGRGWLFAQAVIIGKDGKTKTLPIMNPAEIKNPQDDTDTQAKPIVTPRATAINALFATGTWRTMQSAQGHWQDQQPTMKIQLGDYGFALEMNKPAITVDKAGKPLGKFALPTITANAKPSSQPSATEEHCGVEQGYAKAIHFDETTKRALIEVGRWSTGHNCGAGMAEFAVVTLP